MRLVPLTNSGRRLWVNLDRIAYVESADRVGGTGRPLTLVHFDDDLSLAVEEAPEQIAVLAQNAAGMRG